MTNPDQAFWVEWYMALGADEETAQEKAREVHGGAPRPESLPDGTTVDA